MPTSVGERAVGDPGVGVQGGQDAPVDVVEIDGPNILRRTGPDAPSISLILLT